jgi:hypothetical protein
LISGTIPSVSNDPNLHWRADLGNVDTPVEQTPGDHAG